MHSAASLLGKKKKKQMIPRQAQNRDLITRCVWMKIQVLMNLLHAFGPAARWLSNDHLFRKFKWNAQSAKDWAIPFWIRAKHFWKLFQVFHSILGLGSRHFGGKTLCLCIKTQWPKPPLIYLCQTHVLYTLPHPFVDTLWNLPVLETTSSLIQVVQTSTVSFMTLLSFNLLCQASYYNSGNHLLPSFHDSPPLYFQTLASVTYFLSPNPQPLFPPQTL